MIYDNNFTGDGGYISKLVDMDKWYHIAIVIYLDQDLNSTGQATITRYLNGVEYKNTTPTIGSNANLLTNQTYKITDYQITAGFSPAVRFNDIRVYNYKLSVNDIIKLYNNPTHEI